MEENKQQENEQELVTKYFGPEKESKKLFTVFAASIIITIAVLGAVWFMFLKQNNIENLNELTIIEADQGDIKVKPTDPGGEKIEHLDKSVYNTFAKKKDNLPKVEKLMDFEAEERNISEELPIAYKEVANNKNELEKVAKKDYHINHKENNIFSKEKEVAKVSENSLITANKQKIDPKMEIVELPIPVKKMEEVKKINIINKEDIAKLPINNKIKKEYTVKVENESKKTEPGIYIQLASLKNKKTADNNLKRISQNHKDILEKYNFQIEEKLIEGKGTFYRLQVGQIEDDITARKLCNILNERKENCFIVRK